MSCLGYFICVKNKICLTADEMIQNVFLCENDYFFKKIVICVKNLQHKPKMYDVSRLKNLIFSCKEKLRIFLQQSNIKLKV